MRPESGNTRFAAVRLRGISFFSHETFALLIYWVSSGGTGKPAAVYEGRTEPCPSGFFMEIGRVSSSSWSQPRLTAM